MKPNLGNRFPKSLRLTSNTSLKELFLKGEYLSGENISIKYIQSAQNQSKTKVAVVAPKKKFNRAVDRNRIKRVLRELYRTQLQFVPNTIASIAIIYSGPAKVDYSTLKAEWQELMKMLSIKVK